MLKAAFPGSFDPPTNGHLHIIERAAALFDEVLVVVADNRHKGGGLFTVEERLALLEELVKPFCRVSVARCDTLVVRFLKERKIPLMIRGIRAVQDFPAELELALMNRALEPGVETFFIPADPAYSLLRSSGIKELASFHEDLSAWVPPAVARALNSRQTWPG